MSRNRCRRQRIKQPPIKWKQAPHDVRADRTKNADSRSAVSRRTTGGNLIVQEILYLVGSARLPVFGKKANQKKESEQTLASSPTKVVRRTLARPAQPFFECRRDHRLTRTFNPKFAGVANRSDRTPGPDDRF